VEAVLRGLAIYLTLLVIFRLTGKRSLGQITTVDFVLLLVISEAVQNGMVGQSYSITTALVLVLTLVGVDLGLSLLKERSVRFQKWIEGLPLILVDEGDILGAAREAHGLERLDQIKYAVLERNGGISVIPWRPEAERGRERPAA
jgi:uncharacterized membrane protein YcaP (DUF421 family)